MIIELPFLNLTTLLQKKSSSNRHIDIKYYLLDILDIEYPKGLEIFRKKQDLAVLFQDNTVLQIQHNFLYILQHDFKNVYCRNVYKACLDDLYPSDEDLEKAVNLCGFSVKEEFDITQIIKILSQENASFESFHQFSKNDSYDDIEDAEENGAGALIKLADSDNASEHDDYQEELDCDIVGDTVDCLVKWYYKRVTSKNLYVEQTEGLESLIKEFKAKNQLFIDELAHLHCKPVN